MAREFMNFVEGRIETPFGPMHFAITQYDHVSISAGGGSSKLPGIWIRKIQYYTHLHLYRQADGSWIRKDEYREPYMSREGTAGDTASRAAKDKAYEGIRQAWEAFIAGGDVMLLEAERGHVNNEIRSLEEKIEKVRLEWEQLEDKRKELLTHEGSIKEDLGKFVKQGGYPTPRDWSPRGEVPEHGEEEEI